MVAIKIGMLAVSAQFTLQSAVRRRLSRIQTSNHEPVQVLGRKPCQSGAAPTRDAEALERKSHIEFVHSARLTPDTRGSEWFHSSVRLPQRVSGLSVPLARLGVSRSIAMVAIFGQRDAK